MTVKYLNYSGYRFLSTKTWNCSIFYRISSQFLKKLSGRVGGHAISKTYTCIYIYIYMLFFSCLSTSSWYRWTDRLCELAKLTFWGFASRQKTWPAAWNRRHFNKVVTAVNLHLSSSSSERMDLIKESLNQRIFMIKLSG